MRTLLLLVLVLRMVVRVVPPRGGALGEVLRSSPPLPPPLHHPTPQGEGVVLVVEVGVLDGGWGVQ